jgi:hypothetical protein
VPDPGKAIGAVHWYSPVEPTVMEILVAAAVLVGVHVPPDTTPHVADPVLCDRSVPQLMRAEFPTTSVT